MTENALLFTKFGFGLNIKRLTLQEQKLRKMSDRNWTCKSSGEFVTMVVIPNV